jgi:pantetheine-phosphate adenylyltransferase
MRLLFPGSFDPPHLGHRDVIQRAAALARSGGGELLVAVADNPDKPGWLPIERRLALVAALCAEEPGARAVTYRGATVLFAQTHAVDALVRGIRNPLDFEHEKSMAEVNRSHGIDTMFFMTAGVHAHLSSHLVRSAKAAGLPLTGLIPPSVALGL